LRGQVDGCFVAGGGEGAAENQRACVVAVV
jgi:hypothetical protein